MAMVYGRRRLGKTFLLQHYFSGSAEERGPKRYCYYLAEQSTAEMQRLAFAERLLNSFPEAGASAREISIS